MRAIESIQFAKWATIKLRSIPGSRLRATGCLALALSVTDIAPAATHEHHHEPTRSVKLTRNALPSNPDDSATRLPVLPAGVTELKFNEFFVSPVGPRGLELTGKLRGLEGKRVRILGYMAHREAQPPGVFLLAPYPVQVHDHDNGLAEDFPVSVVQVSVPTLRDRLVPFAPGLMLLTGTLSLGNRAEPDGRISLVRMELDPPSAFPRQTARPGRPSETKGAALLMR